MGICIIYTVVYLHYIIIFVLYIYRGRCINIVVASYFVECSSSDGVSTSHPGYVILGIMWCEEGKKK